MATKSDSKGFGVAALVLGIVGIVGSWVPVLNWFSIILGILAVIFGILAVVKTESKSIGIAGLVIGAATVVICIIINALAVKVVDDAVKDATGSESYQQLLDDIEELNDSLR